MKKEHIWLACMVLGPLTAFFSIYYPALIMIALVFFIIGLKGVLVDIM